MKFLQFLTILFVPNVGENKDENIKKAILYSIIAIIAFSAVFVTLAPSDILFWGRLCLPLVSIVFSIIGLIINGKELYGFAVASLFPTFLTSLLDIYLECYEFVPLNIIAFVFGIIIFKIKELPSWKIIFMWGFVYFYGFILLQYFQLNTVMVEYTEALGGINYFFYLIVNPFIIIVLVNLKEQSKIENFSRESSKTVQRIQKTLDKNMEKFHNKFGYNYFTEHIDWIIMIAIGIGWGIIKGSLYPLSGWAFAVSICLFFYNDKYFSSYLGGLVISLIYLMITSGFELTFLWFFNLVYHLFIVGTGLWVLFKKRDANWEIILIFSLFLKIYVIMMHNLVGYLPDGGNLLHLSYIDIVILVLFVFFYHNFNFSKKE